MKTNEGVRRVTDRMELINRLRNSLLKARLSLIATITLLVVSGAVNIMLFKELKETRTTNEAYAKVERQLNIEVQELEQENEKLEGKLEEANSFNTLMNKVMNLEEIALEAAHQAKGRAEGRLSYKVKDRSVITDIKYTDYILDSKTGQKIRVMENKTDMFVVYIDNDKATTELTKAMGRQYYLGIEDYKEVIDAQQDTIMIRHDVID